MKKKIFVVFAWWLFVSDWTAAYVHTVKHGPLSSYTECVALGKEAVALRSNLVLKSWCKEDTQLQRESQVLQLTSPLERVYTKYMQRHLREKE